MKLHTFFICTSEEQFWSLYEAAKRLCVMTAMAAETVVVCKGAKEALLKAGLPDDVPSYEAEVPIEVIQGLSAGYVRNNVQHLALLYGKDPVEAMMVRKPLLLTNSYRAQQKAGRKPRQASPVEPQE